MKQIYRKLSGICLKSRGPVRLCSTSLVVLCVFISQSWRASAQNPPGGQLTKAAQVRNLTTQQAGEGRPVMLKGVVTFFDAGIYSRFIQDDTAGIYFGESTNMPALKPGQIIEIQGVTSPGEFAPIVVPTIVKVVGQGPLPAAKPVAVEQLVSGSEDSQFVEVSGIVRSVRFEEESQHHLIDLVTGGERFTAYAKEVPAKQIQDLVDSTVKIRGVCATLFNRQRQLFGFNLLVPRADDVVVEKPSSGNPFDVPAKAIGSLLQFSTQGSFGHRVKLVGTVAYHEPGSAVFIQDDKEGVYCQTRQRTPLRPGDRVEVLGFPAKGEYTPVLQDAIYRKVGDGTAPVPVVMDLDDILSGTHDCRLIRITANLLERTQRGREQFLVLEKSGFIFHAYLGQDSDGTGFSSLKNGSEVSVAGICLIERGSSWRAGEGWRAKSFRLLLRTPEDVVVETAPPFWKEWGIGRVGGVLLIIILGAFLWISVLHRRIAAHETSKT